MRVVILLATAQRLAGAGDAPGPAGAELRRLRRPLEGVEAPRTDGDREMAGEEGIPLCDRMR